MEDHRGPVIFDLSQFGPFLNGREEGNTAFHRLEEAIASLPEGQKLFLDVDKVKVFNPSFVDESLAILEEKYPGRFVLTGRMSLAVRRGLEHVESLRNLHFPYADDVSQNG